MLKCIDSLCASSRESNEDLVLINTDFTLVMDGSTNLGMYNNLPDAAWFVKSFSNAFSEHFCKENLKLSISLAIKSTSQQFLQKTSLNPYSQAAVPSASFSLVYEDNNDIVIALLGDCTAVLYPKAEKPYALYQKGVDRLDKIAMEKLISISKKENISPALARKYPDFEAILKKNRSLMNTPEGYWILSFNTEALEHMDVYRIPACDISHIALFTDGFELKKQELLQGLPNKSLKELYNEIFKEEELDYDLLKHPRFKLHDDVSCVLLEVG